MSKQVQISEITNYWKVEIDPNHPEYVTVTVRTVMTFLNPARPDLEIVRHSYQLNAKAANEVSTALSQLATKVEP